MKLKSVGNAINCCKNFVCPCLTKGPTGKNEGYWFSGDS